MVRLKVNLWHTSQRAMENLHSTMVRLKGERFPRVEWLEQYLHSTMVRLKGKELDENAVPVAFTFHYGQIKSHRGSQGASRGIHLHSTMVRLKVTETAPAEELEHIYIPLWSD